MNTYATAAITVFSLLGICCIAVIIYDQVKLDGKILKSLSESSVLDNAKKTINFANHCRNIAVAIFAVQSITSGIALSMATSKDAECCSTPLDGYEVTCVDSSEYDKEISSSGLSTFFTLYSLLAFATVANLLRLSEIWKYKFASLGYLYSLYTMRAQSSHKVMVFLNLVFALIGLIYAMAVMNSSDGDSDEVNATVFAFITLCFMILEFYSSQELEIKIESDDERISELKEYTVKMGIYDFFFQDATAEIGELEDRVLYTVIHADSPDGYKNLQKLLGLEEEEEKVHEFVELFKLASRKFVADQISEKIELKEDTNGQAGIEELPLSERITNLIPEVCKKEINILLHFRSVALAIYAFVEFANNIVLAANKYQGVKSCCAANTGLVSSEDSLTCVNEDDYDGSFERDDYRGFIACYVVIMYITLVNWYRIGEFRKHDFASIGYIISLQSVRRATSNALLVALNIVFLHIAFAYGLSKVTENEEHDGDDILSLLFGFVTIIIAVTQLYVNQELKFENPSGEVSVTEWKYKKMTIFTETTDLLMEVKDTLLHHLMRTGEAGPDTYKHELARLQKVFVKNKDNEELTEKDVKDLAANLKRFNAEERDEVTVKMVDPEESATCASLKTEGNEPSWFNWLREIAPCAPSWDPFSRACDHAFVCKEGSVFLDEKGDEDKNCLPFHSDKKFKSKQTVTIDKKKKTRTERITYYDKNEKTTVFDLNMEMKDGIN